MRSMVLLGALPLLVFGTVSLVKAVSKPAAATGELPVKTVRTIRIVEATPFRVRWESVNELPVQLAQLRRQPGEVTPVPAPAPRPDVVLPPRQPPVFRKPKPDKARGHNVCTRHGMRKTYTRGGRSWRCRR